MRAEPFPFGHERGSSLMWEVRGSQRVAKLIAGFDPEVRKAYSRAFKRLSETPNLGKSLRGHEELRSIPVTTTSGEHRIIYRLMPRECVVYVVLVGSREGIYELLERRGPG